jgi:hypothetical protein
LALVVLVAYKHQAHLNLLMVAIQYFQLLHPLAVEMVAVIWCLTFYQVQVAQVAVLEIAHQAAQHHHQDKDLQAEMVAVVMQVVAEVALAQ